MSGICPNHGPYDGDACPYPPPHGSKEIIDAINSQVELEDSDATDLAQSVYDGLRSKGRFLDEDDDSVDETELQYSSSDIQSALSIALLWVKDGRRRGRAYPIRHGTVIGRKVADIVLDDPKVSSLHAKFTREGDDFVIWDFGSANGTYVNGKKIREATILDENDLVKIGDTVFVLKLLEPKKK